MRMGLIVLAQQVFPVVVAIRRANYCVNVLPIRLIAVCGKLSEVCRTLMVELDQDHRAVDAVVEDTVWRRSADPGEPGVGEMALYFFHSYSRMVGVHIADIQVDEVNELLALVR